jgi:hypothetical protein
MKGVSPEEMEKKAKEAIEKSVKSRRDLYGKFMPTPKELGPGWLLPWEIPAPLRKYASEEAFWQATSGGSGAEAVAPSTLSMLLELPPEELDSFLDAMVSMTAKEIPDDILPPGMTKEQFCMVPILLALRLELSPSLAKKMEFISSYLAEMQKAMGERATQLGQDETTEAGVGGSEQQFLMELVTRPLKGMNVQEMRRAVIEEASVVQKMTSMMYTTCDNWDALKSAKEEDLERIHFRQVVVSLMVLDRDRMGKAIDDLKPEQAAQLQSKLSQRLGEFREFSIEVFRKMKIAELQDDLRKEKDPARRKRIQSDLAKVPEEVEEFKKQVPKMEAEAYTRDFGDNCYVINMKGKFNLPESTFPMTNMNACLRNGNAVVFIGLGGNFTPEQMKEELDHFLSEMDVKTAFFRE